MHPWIPDLKLQSVLQWDLFLLCQSLALGSWIFYRAFLNAVMPSRHATLQRHFRNLLVHCIALTVCFLCYRLLRPLFLQQREWLGFFPYFGLGALVFGCTVLIKASRIAFFEYLFLSNMRAGVPVLIVNLLTLFLSLVLGVAVLGGVFGLQLAPLLATSAIFSIVLGLALQDTLGNLAAGLALALDKPYEIGDWIEVQNGAQKWSGKVQEITWRATLLTAFTDEVVTIPNRVLAQAHIANFAGKARPFLRVHILHFLASQFTEKTRELLLEAAYSVPQVHTAPQPLVLVVDAADARYTVKLVYAIDDYGRQTIIADRVLSAVMERLERAGVSMAPPPIVLHPLS